MIHSELDAAGVSQPRLRDAYRRCRQLNARHGRTFFLATRLLAPAQRPAVHALYGFARLADDILDDLDPPLDKAAKTTMLQRFSDRFFENGARDDDKLDDDEMGLVLAAVRHTAAMYGIDQQLFSDFLTSMRMDLTVTDYPDRASLNTYMHGSAEVIGLELLPVLGTVGCGARKSVPADQLSTRRRRGPDPGAGVSARRRARRVRRRPGSSDLVSRESADRSPGAQRVGRAAPRHPGDLSLRR